MAPTTILVRLVARIGPPPDRPTGPADWAGRSAYRGAPLPGSEEARELPRTSALAGVA